MVGQRLIGRQEGFSKISCLSRSPDINYVINRELFILWVIMHFSYEECDCMTILFCVGLQVQEVRKSDPKQGGIFKLQVGIFLFGYVEKELLPFLKVVAPLESLFLFLSVVWYIESNTCFQSVFN